MEEIISYGVIKMLWIDYGVSNHKLLPKIFKNKTSAQNYVDQLNIAEWRNIIDNNKPFNGIDNEEIYKFLQSNNFEISSQITDYELVIIFCLSELYFEKAEIEVFLKIYQEIYQGYNIPQFYFIQEVELIED